MVYIMQIEWNFTMQRQLNTSYSYTGAQDAQYTSCILLPHLLWLKQFTSKCNTLQKI